MLYPRYHIHINYFTWHYIDVIHILNLVWLYISIYISKRSS